MLSFGGLKLLRNGCNRFSWLRVCLNFIFRRWKNSDFTGVKSYNAKNDPYRGKLEHDFRGWKMRVGGRVELKIMMFFFKTRFLPEILVQSLRGCEKWILQKILHRYSYPKNFPTFYFRRRKNILKILKNIFENVESFNKNQLIDFF